MGGRVTFEEVVSLRERLATAEQRATDAEATLATIGGADKATLARKLRRANAATRDAEQRATESAALVREIAAKHENDWLPDGILIAVGGPVFDVSVCCFCEAKIFGDDAKIEAHEPDCLWLRSKKLVALLDSNGLNAVE